MKLVEGVPLNILLIGNYKPDRQESMQRFAELMKGRLESSGQRVRLLRPMPVLNRGGKPPNGLAKWTGYVDKFLIFPLVLRRAMQWADVIHICDHSNAPYTCVLRKATCVVTCHDVLAIKSALGYYPENPTGWSGKILQRSILRGLQRSPLIACDSQNTQRELLEISGLSATKTLLIPIGQNYYYTPMLRIEASRIVNALVGEQALKNGYILHVGGNQWYKNRLGVLKIYKNLQGLMDRNELPMLIMAGERFTSDMQTFIETEELKEFVVPLKGCSNEELRALYSAAEILLFPSLAEGFGWPIIEAQACGCLVITSNIEPMPEVGGPAAIYIDPKMEKQAAEKIATILKDNVHLKERQIEEGIKNASRFSAEQMIQQYLEAYHQVMQA